MSDFTIGDVVRCTVADPDWRSAFDVSRQMARPPRSMEGVHMVVAGHAVSIGSGRYVPVLPVGSDVDGGLPTPFALVDQLVRAEDPT